MTKTVTQKNTPLKPAKSRVRTLDEVVKTPEADVEVMAVVLDCTGYYKTNHSYDYITKVRLIDGTHHPKSGPLVSSGKLAGYVTAYIFSENETTTPTITKIGDILLLRGVSFDTYKGQVKCKVPKRGGQWAVFDGRGNTPKAPLSSSPGNTGLQRGQHDSLGVLRDWALHFFINNSLLNLGWYSCAWPRQLLHDKTYQLKDVDLLVKVLGNSQIIVENDRYQKLAFGDVDRNLYFAELIENHIELESEMMAKLRSVCVIRTGNSMRIDFYKYSSIVLLPEQSRDAKNLAAALAEVRFDKREIEAQFFEEFHLDRYRKRPLSHNTFVYELGDEPGPDLTTIFQILEGFAYTPGSDPMGAYIKKTRLDLPLISLSEATDCLTSERRRKNRQPSEQRLFRVQARLVKATHTDLRQIAYFYSSEANQTWPLSSPPSFSVYKDLRVIFHATLQLQDTSTGAHSQECYLITFDNNPSYFFDLWRLLPDVYSLERWESLKPALLSEFSARFQDFIKRAPKGQFVLELHDNSEGKLYLRVVDTILGFYV